MPLFKLHLPKLVRRWCALTLLTSECAYFLGFLRILASPSARWLRTHRFSEPTQSSEKHSISRTSWHFAHSDLLSSDSPLSDLLTALRVSRSSGLYRLLSILYPTFIQPWTLNLPLLQPLSASIGLLSIFYPTFIQPWTLNLPLLQPLSASISFLSIFYPTFTQPWTFNLPLLQPLSASISLLSILYQTLNLQPATPASISCYKPFIHSLSNLYPALNPQPTATPASISFYKPFIHLLSNLYPTLNPQPTATPASIRFYKPFIHLLSNLYPALNLQPTATPAASISLLSILYQTLNLQPATPASISCYKPFIHLLSNLYPSLNPQPTATPATISFYKPFIPTSPAFSNEEMAGTLEHHWTTAERFRSLWSLQWEYSFENALIIPRHSKTISQFFCNYLNVPFLVPVALPTFQRCHWWRQRNADPVARNTRGTWWNSRQPSRCSPIG